MSDSCIAHWVHARLVYKTHINIALSRLFLFYINGCFHIFFCVSFVCVDVDVDVCESIDPFDSIQTRHGIHTHKHTHTNIRIHLACNLNGERKCAFIRLNWISLTENVQRRGSRATIFFSVKEFSWYFFLFSVLLVVWCGVCLVGFFFIRHLHNVKKMTTSTTTAANTTTTTITWNVEAVAV